MQSIEWGKVQDSLRQAIGYAIHGSCDCACNSTFFSYEKKGRSCCNGVYAVISLVSAVPAADDTNESKDLGFTRYIKRCGDIKDLAENGELVAVTTGAVRLSVQVDIIGEGKDLNKGWSSNPMSFAVDTISRSGSDIFRSKLSDSGLSFLEFQGSPVPTSNSLLGRRVESVAVTIDFLASYCMEGCPVFAIDSWDNPCTGSVGMPGMEIISPANGSSVSSFVITGKIWPESDIVILQAGKVVAESTSDSYGLFSIEAWQGVDLDDALSKWLTLDPYTFTLFAKNADEDLCETTSRCISLAYQP